MVQLLLPMLRIQLLQHSKLDATLVAVQILVVALDHQGAVLVALQAAISSHQASTINYYVPGIVHVCGIHNNINI